MNNDLSGFNALIEMELSSYKAKSAILFDYLLKQSKRGFTKSQFLLYRDNYFFRTYRTIPCVCLVVKSASENEDEETMKSAGQNLIEELGLNGDKKSHAELLRYSHNKHGERVFQINKISLEESLSSPLILNETKEFTQVQLSFYTSSNHIEVLAASYAQEEAATEMLTVFLNSFFKPYKHLYTTKKEFEKLTEYFTCHLNGLEERHADDAKYCLFGQCKNSTDINIAITAISKILTAQSLMWDSLQKQLLLSQDENQIVAINFEPHG